MAKKKILVVDDNESFVKTLKANLEQTGRYEVSTGTKGSEVLAAAKSFRPDLILLDILMPDVDGGTVGNRLKADESIKDIPLVFLTAAVTKEEIDKQHGIIGGDPL